MEIIFNDALVQQMLDRYDYLMPMFDLLAQAIEDPDIIGQLEDAWYNFIDSGQVWALLIGVFFGYIFKGFTG